MGVGSVLIATVLTVSFLIAWGIRSLARLRSRTLEQIADELGFVFALDAHQQLIEDLVVFDFFPSEGMVKISNVLTRTREDGMLLVCDCDLSLCPPRDGPTQATVAVLQTPRRRPPRLMFTRSDRSRALSMSMLGSDDDPLSPGAIQLADNILRSISARVAGLPDVPPQLTIETGPFGILVHGGHVVPSHLIPAVCSAVDEIGAAVREAVPEVPFRTRVARPSHRRLVDPMRRPIDTFELHSEFDWPI